MTFEETLETRKRSAIAVFHRFRIEVRTKSEKFTFVEGFDDLAFYRTIAVGTSRENSNFRITFGKRNMDRIVEWFYSEGYSDTDTIFIRDSDYDKYLGRLPLGDHVFTTCGYSVENYVCAPNVLRRFFLERFCLDTSEVDIDYEVSFFVQSLEILFEWVSPLIGAILLRKQKDFDVDLDRIDFSREFKKILSGKKLGEFEIDKYCIGGLTKEDFTEESAQEGKKFCDQDAMLWFRGHDLMSLTAIYLRISTDRFKKELKENRITQFKRNVSSDFSVPAIFERLLSLAVGTDRLLVAIH